MPMKKIRLLKILTNKLVIIGLILLVGAGWFFFGRGKKTESLQFAMVKRATIQSSISASGVLTGKDSVNLKFKSGGRLSFMGVVQGDSVTLGQTIAQLDSRDLAIALQQAENDYRSKQAAAEKAEDEVKDHSKDENFTQKQTRTTAQAARDSSFDEVKAARLALQNAIISAPLVGLVTQTSFLPGQIVSTTDIIAQIVDFSQIYFDSDVDEADIGKIEVGQKAQVTLNAYGETIFSGTVNQITPQTKTLSSGATVVTVRVLLDNPGISLIANLNGQATIITDQKQNVLVIPQEALKSENSVLVKAGQEIKEVKITAGLRSDTEVEIVSGLNENDEVVINPSAYKPKPKPKPKF